jgi:hypothetical protein
MHSSVRYLTGEFKMISLKTYAEALQQLIQILLAAEKSQTELLEGHVELLTLLFSINERVKDKPEFADIVEWIRAYNDGDMGSKG